MSGILHFTAGNKVLTFGELLLRLSPDEEGEWLRKNRLPFYIAGAELNVATALAHWGVPVSYISALPDNGFSHQIVDFLRGQTIDTQIRYQGSRLGLYFLTKGRDLKHDALVYDRAYSAFSELQPGMIDWDGAFAGVGWFHFSAICPALGANIAAVCREALEAARKKGVVISVDLNYRSRLWNYGSAPSEVMPELVSYCDLIMGNVWSAEKMLGVPVNPNLHRAGLRADYLEQALHTSAEISRRYPRCRAVANTFRFDEHTVAYYAALYTGGTLYTSAEYTAEKIVNRVGSGDCFMAGLIYGFQRELGSEQTLAFAAAAAFAKLFSESDVIDLSAAEIFQRILPAAG